MTTLVWFRDDLRVSDHPALLHAAQSSENVVCLYLLDEESPGIRPLGGATKWWLHHSLRALEKSITTLGGTLVFKRGSALTVIPEVVAEAGATAVSWNRRYGAPEIAVDTHLKQSLRDSGCEVTSYAASLLHEPWTIHTKTGTPYKVYTPFWNACRAGQPPREPLPAPTSIGAAKPGPQSDDLDDWGLLPTNPDWATGFTDRWEVGEEAAHDRLADFLEDKVLDYGEGRDFPSQDVTSGLSAHLRWGEISPYTVWHEAMNSGKDVAKFLSEVGWREFAWHCFYHNPQMATQNLNARFDAFPWPEQDDTEVLAWKRGQTGIELVDAGMRELWVSGTMHNRVRMIAASFLIKNLLVDWRLGEQWFWDTLVDADSASNPFNWQWVAGSGFDATPYFRVFNPATQQKKFDGERKYIDTWLTKERPREPIVNLAESRKHALAAFEHMRNA